MTSTYNTPENPQKSAENFAENRSREMNAGAPNDTACENQNEPSLSARADRVVGWIHAFSSRHISLLTSPDGRTDHGLDEAGLNLRHALVDLVVGRTVWRSTSSRVGLLSKRLDALEKRVEAAEGPITDPGFAPVAEPAAHPGIVELAEMMRNLERTAEPPHLDSDILKRIEHLGARLMHVEQAGKMDEQRIDELSKRVEQIGDLNRVTRVRLDVLNTRVAQLEGTHTGPGPTDTLAGTHEKLKPDPRLDSPGVKCQSNAETAVRADVWK